MRKKIKKVSVAPIDPITGSIVDTTNIDDKTSNTYSANVIDGLLSSSIATWHQASVNTEFINGRVYYYQIGKLVIVDVQDWLIIKDFPVNETLLAFGLPTAKTQTIGVLNGTDGSQIDMARVVIGAGGSEIKSWYHKKTAHQYVMYYGQLFYFTE